MSRTIFLLFCGAPASISRAVRASSRGSTVLSRARRLPRSKNVSLSNLCVVKSKEDLRTDAGACGPIVAPESRENENAAKLYDME